MQNLGQGRIPLGKFSDGFFVGTRRLDFDFNLTQDFLAGA